MSFRHFRIQVILRILMIIIFLIGLIYFVLVDLDEIKAFFLLSFSVMAVINLFYYVDKSNNEVAGFLNAILNNDYSNKYSDSKKGKSFRAMYESFNAVNAKLNQFSQANESQYLYISTLVRQLQIGIISFDDQERIGLINDSMKDLFGIQHIVSLKDTEMISPELYEAFRNIESGQSQLLKVTIQNNVRQLSISASEFVLRGKYYKLISIQDIKGELEQTEMDAWQKLIRVLTHEIMNSIAPITSLSNSLHHILKLQSDKIEDEVLYDQLLTGLDAIKTRSDGLMKFTQDYRSLTRIPLPKMRSVNGKPYFTEVKRLFESTLSSEIELSQILPNEDFQLKIDPDLMSQVFINLLKNAKEAIDMHIPNKGKIGFDVFTAGKTTVVKITDNGGGMNDEVQEKMFVPFYTSKENGSGIGLSVVKQIIQLHKGKIEAERVNEQTVFTIEI